MRLKDGDLIECHKCKGKGFNYVESIYHHRDMLTAMYGMLDVTSEDCDTCNGKGVVIHTERENVSC